MTSTAASTNASSCNTALWASLSFLIVVVVAMGVRWSTNLLQLDRSWDEPYILMPIMDLIEQGWSVDTAIDFEEAKGPAMIWPYAIWGDVFGSELNTLRMLSVVCFILTLWPLLLLARRIGLPPPAWPLVAVGLCLLPFELVLAELVMGEPTYVLGVACLLLAAILGAGDRSSPLSEGRRFSGWWVIIYGLLLAVLLHSRVHVVPIAGGVCLTMAIRDGVRSWPWWVASIVAGLLRLPLWARWGGLVSPIYQDMHGLGIRLESLTYLGATLAIPFAVFLLVYLWRYRFLRWWYLAPLGGGIGLALGVLAPPDLMDPQQWGAVTAVSLFQGPTRSLVVAISPAEASQWMVIAGLAAIGLAGLGAFGAMALERRQDTALATLARIQFITIVCAWGLYLFTRGYVFDRFLLAWTAAMPLLWLAMLPRWVWVLQMAAMLAFLMGSINTWLVA